METNKVEWLFGHTSAETAYLIEDYPYGRKLRCKRKVWVETDPKGKKGDRICSMTSNPKHGGWNKPKKSVYQSIAVLYKADNGHIQWSGVNIYTKREEIVQFTEKIGGLELLTPMQRKMYNALMGIHEPVTNAVGNPTPDYRYKWEYTLKQPREADELRITFDRPDGVSMREVFEAMRKANQTKLDQVFKVRKSILGDYAGLVRVMVRGGVQLLTVSEQAYREYCASDENPATHE